MVCIFRMDKLKKHLPVAPENINRLKNIAAQFEEQIYSAATTKVPLLCLYLKQDSLSSGLNLG